MPRKTKENSLLIEPIDFFEHHLLVKDFQSQKKMFEKVIPWCNENCDGMWAINTTENSVSTPTTTIFKGVQKTTDFGNFPPSTITKKGLILSFEFKEDKTKFLMAWSK